MSGMSKEAMNDYELKKFFREMPKRGKEVEDPRYNEPKGKYKASDELIDRTIEETEIYKLAKEHILNAGQRTQVAYGLDKYPIPLSADVWSTIETIEHIVGESVDKLHYLVMLLIKLERINKVLESLKGDESEGDLQVTITIKRNADIDDVLQAIGEAVNG